MRRVMRGLLGAPMAAGLSWLLGPVATAGELPQAARTQVSAWTLVVDDRFDRGRVPAHRIIPMLSPASTNVAELCEEDYCWGSRRSASTMVARPA